MRTFLRGKVTLLFLVLGMLLAVPAIALADNTVADGDGLEPVGNNDMAFGNVACDVESGKSALIAISRQGSATGTNTFKSGSTATVTVQSVTGAGLSAQMGSSNTITLPSDWGTANNGDLSAAVSSTVKVNSSVEGSGSGAVTYRATGVNSAGNPITRDDTMNVSWTTGTCTPPDNTDPTISITTPVNGATYQLNQPVNASYSCDDEAGGSGLKSCVGDVANGAAIDTSTVGSHTFTVNAEDNAGNTAQETFTYNVAYKFIGFSSPVDNPKYLNVLKAGQAVPLKWQLTDYNGVPVTDLSAVKVTASDLSCSLGTSSDLVEELAAGSSGLQNLGGGYYQFNWKSPTSYAKSCKTLTLSGTGLQQQALFNFTK